MRVFPMFVLVVSARASALAQYTEAVNPPTTAQCSASVDTLQLGQLSDSEQLRKAVSIARGCDGAGLRALAMAMNRMKSAPLTGDLYAVFAPGLGDTAILRVAQEIALSATAGVPARVLSLRILLSYVDSSTTDYAELTGAVNGNECLAQADHGLNRGTLPANVADIIRAAIRPLERNGAQPIAVRSAANCVINAWRMQRGLPIQPVATTTAAAFSLQYLCGTRFQINNSLAVPATVEYSVSGFPGRNRFDLAPGATTIRVQGTGAVTLYFDDDTVQTASNTGGSC